MRDDIDTPEAAPVSPSAHSGRVSFERLRERTDELELIISGLSLFTLLSLPGGMRDAFETYHSRLSVEWMAGVVVLLPILSAICFVMAGLFTLHLAVRAHWVGLIGLKSVFPAGVRWERVGGMGAITRERLQRSLPTLDQAISRADALASTLFSLITFSAMALATLGFWMALLFVIGGVFGTRLGGTNAFINQALAMLFLAFIGLPLLRWLLDGVLGRFLPRLAAFAPFRWLVIGIGWAESLLMPRRPLALPRLALQSHLAPRLFLVGFVAATMGVLYTSNLLFQSGRGFDVFDTQGFASSRALLGGLRSAHYESLRVPSDRARPAPMIPSPMIESAFLPVFLPYVALIDDPVLKQRCTAAEPSTEPEPAPSEQAPTDSPSADTTEAADARDQRAQQASIDATACLAKLWEVRIDGVVQATDAFLISQRTDLGLRGLTGFLPLTHLTPGPHTLEVIWRPRPEQDRIAEDYVPRRLRHVIPFVWSPEAAAQPASP